MSLELTPSLNAFGYNISCFGMQDGYINLTINNGTGPYQFNWSNRATTQNIAGLAAGYYSVKVLDLSNGATNDANITLIEPEPIFTSVRLFANTYSNGFNVSCSSCYDGSIATSVESGVSPFLFEWNDGATTPDRAAIHAGAYEVTVTGANGCAVTEQIILTAPEREDWTAFGNSGSNPSIHFLGTIDNKDLIFKTNSIERFRIKNNGDFKLSGLLGSGDRILFADQNGILSSKNIIIPSCNDPLVLGFQQSPFNATNIYTCWHRIGIGTDDPQVTLHVKGDVRFSWWQDINKYISLGQNGNDGFINTSEGSLLLNYANAYDVVIGGGNPNNYNGKLISNGIFKARADAQFSGNVGIGVDPTNPGLANGATPYKLLVGGKLGATEIWCAPGSPWPDYIFNKDYQLKSLDDLESFICKEKHLPGLPSTDEIKGQEKINMSEMLIKILEKTEENTLYILQLKRENEQLKEENKKFLKLLTK